MYFYVYNLQGDVTHILDDDANIVGTYTYDAWGKITNLSSLTSIAQTNPFRYRGYYYDTESGLYYLNRRYYNPEWGRFLNADDASLLGANGDFASYNLFAYCGNNPIVRADDGGECWETIGIMAIGGLIGGVISAVSSAVTQQVLSGTVNWKSVGVAAITGIVSGAIAASPLRIVGQQIAGGVVGGLSYIADCYVNNKAVKLDEAILSVGMGVISGRIGGSGANEKMILSNTIKNTKQTVVRETRRTNQDYAAKAIASTVNYCKNTLTNSAWDASFKFAVGTGVSNGISVKYSSYGFFANVPSLKLW